MPIKSAVPNRDPKAADAADAESAGQTLRDPGATWPAIDPNQPAP